MLTQPNTIPFSSSIIFARRSSFTFPLTILNCARLTKKTEIGFMPSSFFYLGIYGEPKCERIVSYNDDVFCQLNYAENRDGPPFLYES